MKTNIKNKIVYSTVIASTLYQFRKTTYQGRRMQTVQWLRQVSLTKIGCFAGLVLFLQACVSTDSVSVKEKPADSWELTGKIGMMYPEANCIGHNCKMRSDQGGIKWVQAQQDYHIVLNDPFGRAVLQISGNNQQLKASAPGQRPMIGTPEEFAKLLTNGKAQNKLLANLTPKDLSYWVTGRPNPDYETTQNKNNFEQKGYTIGASQWRATPVGYMPSLVQLKKGQVKLRIVVKEWEKIAK